MKSLKFLVPLSALAFSLSALASGTHGGSDEAVGVGKAGDPAKVTRTIQVDMTDNMRYTPPNINVKRGETIRFIAKNDGKIKHEMVIGTIKELKEHSEMMKKMPGMQHAEGNMVTVDPGKTGELVWQFTKPGKVDFACLQPGHYEAGMKGVVNVAGGKAHVKH